MAYSKKTDCDRVSLFVLANADKSLVGLKFRNLEIISISVKEYSELLIETGQNYLYYNFIDSLAKNYISPTDDNMLIVIEAIENGTGGYVWPDQFCDYLRLYKAEDIYTCFFICYRFKQGCMSWGGLGRVLNVRTHGVGLFVNPYCLSEGEKKDVPDWIENYFYAGQEGKTYHSIRENYLFSYYLGNVDMEYIMLFSILESLIGASSEITYQISRGVAILLSNNQDEFNALFKKMKTLYNVRSKYVHASNHIEKENLAQLREIVRRTILRLKDLEITSDEQIKDLHNKLTLAGYPVFDN